MLCQQHQLRASTPAMMATRPIPQASSGSFRRHGLTRTIPARTRCSRRGSIVTPQAIGMLNRLKTIKPKADVVLKGNTLMWGVKIISSTPLLGDSGTNLTFKLVDKVTDERTEAFSIDSWEPPFEIMMDGVKGWARTGTIVVPAGLLAPSAIMVQKKDTAKDAHSLDYISEVSLRSPHDGRHIFPIHSWVSSEQGERIFFEGTPYLPKDTPAQIQEERQAELDALRGEGGAASKYRTYKYNVYNDLGPNRPPLGGSTALPYPRRLDTAKPGKDSLPYDEQFNYSKQTGFQGDALAGVAMAFTQITAANVGVEPEWYNVLPVAVVGFAKSKLGISKAPEFKRFEDVLTCFKPPKEGPTLDDDDAKAINKEVAAAQIGLVSSSATGLSFKQQQETKKEEAKGLLPTGGMKAVIDRTLSTLFKDSKESGGSPLSNINDLLSYPLPKVELNRAGQWQTDLEFGRQALAGMNPCVLTALTQMPSARGSAIGPEHVDALLKKLDPQGRTMAQLVEAAAKGECPQLFIIDYWILNAFWKEAPEVKNRSEHIGRCIFYLKQKDGQDVGLVPIAIELANRATVKGAAGVVYSKAQLTGKQEVLWNLAKVVFMSIEAGYHQLVSHWLRCHACIEPFMIALRRQISILHPVAKLMIPHFRYTLNINSNARESLISENGTIEKVFTPAGYAIRLSSAAYGLWRFTQQALPVELHSRGMVNPDGKMWLDDYPYAQDGLDIWNAFQEYFTAYLQLYYKNDQEVLDDVEVQAWWTECKEVGHADVTAVLVEQLKKGGMDAATAKTAAEQEIWGFNGRIPTISKLAWILTTIAWTTSGHHAAVNFGQYDYASLLMNVSCTVARPIPKPDDVNSIAYKALVDSQGDAQERELLTYMSSFADTLAIMTTVKLLSTHADDEQTLNEPNTMITDPAAVALNQKFINKMEALEMRFVNRNRDPKNWTRVKGKPEALEYTLMYPSSKAGVTMRGVPYSVSI